MLEYVVSKIFAVDGCGFDGSSTNMYYKMLGSIIKIAPI
jgi:hypothetical protein